MEEGSVFLTTACVWRVAPTSMAALTARELESGSQELGQNPIVLNEMPAVEVFGVAFGHDQAGADYPFTSFFYESVGETP